MEQDIAQLLTPQEVEFVERVFKNPGCKLSYETTHHSFDDGSEYGASVNLWDNPEKLGLVECVGSYKWKPVSLKMRLFKVD